MRDLVNTSPSHLYPATLAAEAGRVAEARGLGIEVLDEKALAEGGYGGIVGVGQGSVHPPRLVRLAYTHPDAARTVVFAGKGITFDSGGLSLKPPKSMEAMKSDMGGAAAVLAANRRARALASRMSLGLELHTQGKLQDAGGSAGCRDHAKRSRSGVAFRN